MSQRLLLGLLGLVVLAAAVLWLLPDRTARATGPAVEAAAPAVARAPAELVAASEPVRRVEVSLDADAGSATTSAAEAGAATRVLTGRLLLDGRAPPADTRVYLEGEDETSRGPWIVRPDGSFTIAAPVTPGAALSFRLSEQGPRALLLPRVAVAALEDGASGLDWRTRHLNVRVSGDPANWNAARLRVTGPDLASEVEVGEDGRLSLAVVLPGRYDFEARHASGATARATALVGADEDLDTVVLLLARAE